MRRQQTHVFKCMNCWREWDVHSTSDMECSFRGLCYDCLSQGYRLQVVAPIAQQLRGAKNAIDAFKKILGN